MSLQKYIQAFGFAFQGIFHFVKNERNAKVHLVAAAFAIAISWYLHISPSQWLWVLLAIAMVFIAEMVNTAIEGLCNKITTDIDADIKIIKDISAGFVLIASLFAVAVAATIFTPYLF